MKKILILLLLAASMTAQAQFTVGINTGFDRFGRGETGSKTYTLIATPDSDAERPAPKPTPSSPRPICFWATA